MSFNLAEKQKHEDVVQKAISVFRDIDRALSWLNAPCNELDDQIPIHLLETADGVKLVMDMLDRIEQGLISK